ncbi:neuronal acetylcholine receptor subunit alpha-6-like isoform X2 [Anneissia japonica]|nr:neuronal acetylcholine receptor subunit alpha-6-like isoform X2 [Anneissia japonica]
MYSTYSVFQSSCHVNIKLYPYDNQTCMLRFGSWNYDVYELDVYPQLRELDQKDHFYDNGVWTLQGVDAWREVEEYKTDSNPFAYAVFSIQLKRRHEFYYTFILVPYHFCAFLITLMFFIPFENGEKLSYGVTVLLGSIVFQQIIALSLPPVGKESSVIGMYCNAVIGIGVISVAFEILLRLPTHKGFTTVACKICSAVCKIRSKSDKQSSVENGETDQRKTHTDAVPCRKDKQDKGQTGQNDGATHSQGKEKEGKVKTPQLPQDKEEENLGDVTCWKENKGQTGIPLTVKGEEDHQGQTGQNNGATHSQGKEKEGKVKTPQLPQDKGEENLGEEQNDAQKLQEKDYQEQRKKLELRMSVIEFVVGCVAFVALAFCMIGFLAIKL